jgi:hypothetical protein
VGTLDGTLKPFGGFARLEIEVAVTLGQDRGVSAPGKLGIDGFEGKTHRTALFQDTPQPRLHNLAATRRHLVSAIDQVELDIRRTPP